MRQEPQRSLLWHKGIGGRHCERIISAKGALTRTAIIAFACLLFTSWLYAQINTSSVAGTGDDSTGGAVPAATVQLTQVTTGFVRTAKSDDVGQFVIVGLEPGEYSLNL